MDWQNFIALAVVACAICVLVRQGLAFVRAPAAKGCGSCPSRGHSAQAGCASKNGLQLVQIDTRPPQK